MGEMESLASLRKLVKVRTRAVHLWRSEEGRW